MRRPVPHIPRGRGIRRPPLERLLLGCPKVCPEWQLGAIRALIKPQFKNAIKHRSSAQKLPRGAEEIVTQSAAAIEDKLGIKFLVHFPPAGEYHFIADVSLAEIEAAKALAVLVTRRLPTLWLTLGKWYVRGGTFYRKQRSYNILLKPAGNVHLNRESWSKIRGELASCNPTRSSPSKSRPRSAARSSTSPQPSAAS